MIFRKKKIKTRQTTAVISAKLGVQYNIWHVWVSESPRWLLENEDIKSICGPHRAVNHMLKDTCWAKWQKPAKNYIKQFVKLTDHTYSCNILTKFDYEAHDPGNGNAMEE